MQEKLESALTNIIKLNSLPENHPLKAPKHFRNDSHLYHQFTINIFAGRTDNFTEAINLHRHKCIKDYEAKYEAVLIDIIRKQTDDNPTFYRIKLDIASWDRLIRMIHSYLDRKKKYEGLI